VIPPIHPFPARMAPDVATEGLKKLAGGSVVLDPMAGSGTVLREATELGHQALGFDMDPLAVLMASVWTSPIDCASVERLADQVIKAAKGPEAASARLEWIDADAETSAFIDYWFAEPQRSDLRRLAWSLARINKRSSRFAAANVLRLALSRIIITKDQGVSLARDTSHSRPHRVADKSSVALFPAFARSVRQVCLLLERTPPKGGCSVQLGDARALSGVNNGSVDAILTSPPYLNAIDYMRGHRFSLVWLGHQLAELRGIRSASIGTEKGPDGAWAAGLFDELLDVVGAVDTMPRRHRGMVKRYCEDIYRLMSEIARVLKPNAEAILVVGNSCLKGQFIRNSGGIILAGKMVGLKLIAQYERELPFNNRYLPMPAGRDVPLGKRMRTESILTFAPVASRSLSIVSG
jgi:SAM-dependent methyltransferase